MSRFVTYPQIAGDLKKGVRKMGSKKSQPKKAQKKKPIRVGVIKAKKSARVGMHKGER